MRHLAVDWLELCRRVGARGDVAGAGAALLGRWAEPHRAYHDLAHLDEVLARVTTLAAEARDVDTVRLAAWFHDAVYDPTKDDNEAQSATIDAGCSYSSPVVTSVYMTPVAFFFVESSRTFVTHAWVRSSKFGLAIAIGMTVMCGLPLAFASHPNRSQCPQ